jgi:hypothetical protein
MTNVKPAAAAAPQRLKKVPMTNWYSPMILVATAIRVAISSVFGAFADRREAIASANAIAPQPFDERFDYSKANGDFWFDYLADTGDGWNSTYAMARLVSAPAISLPGLPELARGRFILLGGDQVYPFASREAYDQRFLAPYEEAYKPGGIPQWKEGEHDLFAVPGNHDWYDGLSSFFGLFCRRRIKPSGAIGFDRDGRVIAGRATNQTRSYFAARLPQNWWIWGTDSQLEGYIDQPQIDYFRHVARYWMDKGSKLILCVDGPRWFYARPDKPGQEFENFSYLERLAAAEVDDQGKPMGHELKLVLTGDSHHYSRFTEGERQYVTAGGGGAFLHPTHHLHDNSFNWRYPPPGTRFTPGQNYVRTFKLAQTAAGSEAVYPSHAKSHALAFWNLAFAAINYRFTATLVVAYAIFIWLLDFNARLSGHGSLRDALQPGSFSDAMRTYWGLAAVSPSAALLIIAALAAYIYAADARNWPLRVITGATHAFFQALAVTSATCAAMRFAPRYLPSMGAATVLRDILITAIASAILSATVYGFYLLVMLRAFGLHWNEGFSSFAHRGFKCFLRLRLGADGTLAIYPIGLEKTPRDRGNRPKNPALKSHLIEGPLIIR